MIDAEAFENNFMLHNSKTISDYGIDVVRLRSGQDRSKYRAIELRSKPLDEENVTLGHLRSETIAEKYQLSLAVENFGRGEGETDLKTSFAIEIPEYTVGAEEKILEAMRTLEAAVEEFYR